MESTCSIREAGACLRIPPDNRSGPRKQASREGAVKNGTQVQLQAGRRREEILRRRRRMGGRNIRQLQRRVRRNVFTLRTAQKLHFYGYFSFAAPSTSRAATFGSSAGNRSQGYLDDAFFLLRAVTEFREIKYDVRKITVGDEVVSEAPQSYTTHLVKNVYPGGSSSLFAMSLPTGTQKYYVSAGQARYIRGGSDPRRKGRTDRK